MGAVLSKTGVLFFSSSGQCIGTRKLEVSTSRTTTISCFEVICMQTTYTALMLTYISEYAYANNSGRKMLLKYISCF